MSSEMDREGARVTEKAGMDGSAYSKQQPIAAAVVQEGHVEVGYDEFEVVKLDTQPRPLQVCNSRGSDGADEANVLGDELQPQEQSETSQGRRGRKRSPTSGFQRSQPCSEIEGGFARERSSSISVDTVMGKVNPTGSMEEASESACLQKSTQDDDNSTRHYVRRSLRRSGDGISRLQSVKCLPNGVVIAAARIPKIYIGACNQFESGQFTYTGVKTEPPSRGMTWQSKLPSSESCHNGEDQDHPCRAPEGSLLHSLYLQLLAAGGDGITLRELFASFATQTSLPRLASNWREQVKAHLKSNPYFEEVKGRYLMCEQLVQPTAKRSAKRNLTAIASGPSHMELNPRSKPWLKNFLQPDPTALSATLSDSSCNVLKNSNEGVQTRRKAYQKTFEAVLNESVMEFQKMQQDKVNGGDVVTETEASTELRASDSVAAEPIEITQCRPAPLQVSMKRKSSDDDEELLPRNIRYGGAIPGSLKAMQAKIVAETGIQNGVRCARKDGSNDSSKWQCPMMAMEGHTLCEHHNFLNERKKARYAKAKKQGESKARQPLHREMKTDTGVSKKHSKGDVVQSLSTPGAEMCKSDIDDIAGLDEVASQALVNMRSEVPVGNSQYETHASASNIEATRKSLHEQPKLVPHFFRSTPKGRYVAAKKTTAKTPYVGPKEKTQEKQSAPLIRPPTIPPLPALYGMRRKSVKNRSLLSL